MLINDAHIWVAQFKSKKALEAYMDEVFDEDDEDAPISRFAADQRVAFPLECVQQVLDRCQRAEQIRAHLRPCGFAALIFGIADERDQQAGRFHIGGQALQLVPDFAVGAGGLPDSVNAPIVLSSHVLCAPTLRLWLGLAGCW